jgi:hypothetical protein
VCTILIYIKNIFSLAAAVPAQFELTIFVLKILRLKKNEKSLAPLNAFSFLFAFYRLHHSALKHKLSEGEQRCFFFLMYPNRLAFPLLLLA